MDIISIINQKGGVAKTTTTINLAASWAKDNKRVLVIDMDPQSSATRAIFGDQEFDQTVYDIIINKLAAEQAIVRAENFGFDVIPSEIMLSGVDIQIAAQFGRERLLRQKLEPLRRKYDMIVIDCPPSLGLLTINALMASKDIIIPICPEYFSIKGIELILETLQNIRVSLDHRVGVRGVIITRYRDRKITNKMIDELQRFEGLRVMSEYVPDNIAVEEAHHRHLPVYKVSVASKAAKAYQLLSKELWA